MKKEKECIICKKKAQLVIENSDAYIKGEKYNIYYCQFCNTSFASPHTVNNTIYDYIYRQPEIVRGYNRYALYAEEIKHKKNALNYLAEKEGMYYAVKEILDNYKKEIKILEVGSGLGYLTFAIAKEGYNINGLDISLDAVNKARTRFGDYFICEDVFKYADEHPALFDLVILTEVIEHVPEPINFCKGLARLLKPGGRLIISTPNKSAHRLQEYWYTELPPVHLTWFSEDSFLEIARQMNLKASFFDFTVFNKNHLDVTKYKFAESYFRKRKITTTLNPDGTVIQPMSIISYTASQKVKIYFKKIMRSILDPIVIRFFTDKKNPARNGVLCAILQNTGD
ncbi:MAG: class I SAM-dependent methyltransferase [Bacteroidota bacterium]|nr:class I SAM-dependent methyltransferase [Bacteroidota bacterium]